MRAFRFLLSMVVLTGLNSASGQFTDESLWRFAHPDAKFLIGVDWQKAKTSPVGRMIEKQMTLQKGGRVTKASKGFEFLESVERILVSSPNVQGVSSEDPGQVVVALEGKIDRAALKKSLPDGTAVERRKGVDVYVPPKGLKDQMVLAVVSDRMAVAGDWESITVLLDGSGGLKDQGLLERATHLASSCEIWMVGSAPLMKKGTTSGGMGQQLEDIESMELGIMLAKGLGVEMNMIMASVESAQGMAMLSQFMVGMASNQTRESTELTRALRAVKVSSEGKRVHLSIEIPAATIEREMTQVRASIQDTGRKTLDSMLGVNTRSARPTMPPLAASARVDPPMPATPSKPKTIKIVGLDGGDREISFRPSGTN